MACFSAPGLAAKFGVHSCLKKDLLLSGQVFLYDDVESLQEYCMYVMMIELQVATAAKRHVPVRVGSADCRDMDISFTVYQFPDR